MIITPVITNLSIVSDELVKVEDKMKWFNKKDSGKKESNEGNAIMTMIFLKVKKHSHRENELKVAGKSRAYSSQSFVFFFTD